MVVIETKSQILEMGAHEMTIGQYNNNTNSIKTNPHLVCTQSVEDALQMTAYINEGYMKLKPLLYPCTIEFSLMCLTVGIRTFVFVQKTRRKIFSYFFLSGKILVKHLPIKYRIKLRRKMFLWLIVMHQSKVYLLV